MEQRLQGVVLLLLYTGSASDAGRCAATSAGVLLRAIRCATRHIDVKNDVLSTRVRADLLPSRCRKHGPMSGI